MQCTNGRTYCAFGVGCFEYVALNDNFYIGREYFYIGYLDERQLRWLEKDLASVRPGSTVVVCLHIPSTCEEADRKQFSYDNASLTMANHRALYELLKPFRAHIVSGHTHTTCNQPIAPGLYEHVTPALSGAWWQGSLSPDVHPSGSGISYAHGHRTASYHPTLAHPAHFQFTLPSTHETPQFTASASPRSSSTSPAR